MRVDINGNVFVTGPGGIWVWDPDGQSSRHDHAAGIRRQPQLGRCGLPHALHHGAYVGVPPENQDARIRAQIGIILRRARLTRDLLIQAAERWDAREVKVLPCFDG